MALAPLVYTLWNRVMRFDPQDPIWPNRDRFVLSNGHASMLLWSILHLTGIQAVNAEYDGSGKPSVTLDDIRQFRQLGSKAPGHPEYHWVSGVETTTGPLGQGVATSVGMAIAQKWLASRYNQPGFDIFDYNIYAVCGDGCMMEGVASEAASLAGHLGLDNLCWIYDNNHITIEGNTSIAFTEDIAARFLAYGWNVLRVGDANDIDRIEHALTSSGKTKGRPTFIILDSHIGYGSPHKQDTAAAHGEPLGEEEVRLTKRDYGWPEDAKFLVPDGVREHFAAGIGARGAQAAGSWTELFSAYRVEISGLATEIDQMQRRELPAGWDRKLPVFPADPKGIAGRDASGKVLNVLAQNIPWLLGGSADLGSSNKTTLTFEGAGDFEPAVPAAGTCISASASTRWPRSSMGCRCPNCGRSARLFSSSATMRGRPSGCPRLMELPTIFVFTHDAMGDGEDGPTHQPVEQLASFRADTRARRAAARRRQRSGRSLSIHHAVAAPAGGARVVAPAAADIGPQQICTGLRGRRGAYVLADAAGGKPEMILIASGSEVSLVRRGAREAAAEGIRSRVVSMPSWEFSNTRHRNTATACCRRRDGARRGRAGLDLRLGTLRRRGGPGHRHEDIRRVGPAQGAAGEIRVRAGPRDRGGERAARQKQESMKDVHLAQSRCSAERPNSK